VVASNKKIIVFILFLTLLLATFLFYKQSEKTQKILRVYTYSSFNSEYGPGSELSDLFKKLTGYKIEYISSDSALTMFRLFKNDTKKVDVFIGVDQFTKEKALKDVSWKKASIRFDKSFYNIFKIDASSKLIPFNWSPMTFIYKKSTTAPPMGWQNILDKKISISIPDPRTSSPGNVYLFWLYSSFKDRFIAATSSLSEHSTWSPSWTTSYGLFTKGKLNMGFSYLSSLAYHWKNKDFDYQAASFKSGHPVHIEYSGVPAHCNHCNVAKRFLNFLVSPEAQKIIMLKNYMLPVRKAIVKGTVFEKLPNINLISLNKISQFNKGRSSIIDSWKKIHRSE